MKQKTSWKQKREAELDRLQERVRNAVNLEAIFALMGLPRHAVKQTLR